MPPEYVPISASTLRANVRLGFDVFIHIVDKHILYIREADFIEDERLKKLISKDVRNLFIQDKDSETYAAFLSSSKGQRSTTQICL